MTAWRYMDYAAYVKTISNGNDFTYAEYSRLKRKPPKAETKPEADAETNNNTSATDETAQSRAATEDAKMEAEKLEKEQLRRTKNQAIRKDNIAYDKASYSKLFIQQKLKEAASFDAHGFSFILSFSDVSIRFIGV
jgi:hypothetical protein